MNLDPSEELKIALPEKRTRKVRSVNFFAVSVLLSFTLVLALLAGSFAVLDFNQSREKSVREVYSSGPVYVVDFNSNSTTSALNSISSRIPEIVSAGFGILVLPVIQESIEIEGSNEPIKLIKSWNEIDPSYGDDQDLRSLVETAHENDLQVLMTLQTSWLSKDHSWAVSHPEWFFETPEKERILNRFGENPEVFSEGELLGARQFKGESFFDVVSLWKESYDVDGVFIQNPVSQSNSLGSRFSERVKKELSADSKFLMFSTSSSASSTSSSSPLTAVVSEGAANAFVLRGSDFNPDNFAVAMSKLFEASKGPIELNPVNAAVPESLSFMRSSSTSLGLSAGIAYAIPGLPIVDARYLDNPINQSNIQKLNEIFETLHRSENRSQTPTLEFFVAKEEGTVGFGVIRNGTKIIVLLNTNAVGSKAASFDLSKKFNGVYINVLNENKESVDGSVDTPLSPGEVRMLVSN